MKLLQSLNFKHSKNDALSVTFMIFLVIAGQQKQCFVLHAQTLLLPISGLVIGHDMYYVSEQLGN